MVFLLRKLENKNKWIADTAVDVCSDALGQDLRTKSDRLSVWRIDANCENLDRVVAAICAGRDFLSSFDFALLPEKEVIKIALVDDSDGVSADVRANTEWHRDLHTLTIERIIGLATFIHAAERRRISPTEVKRIVTQALANNWIDRKLVNQKLLPKIQGPLG